MKLNSVITELEFNGQKLRIRYPAVMGILNATPDSFSDGGRHLGTQKAIERIKQMLDEGAQIIDVGGESTRPGSNPVSMDEELKRVLPILEALPKDDFVISVDTTKPEVAEASLKAGAHIVNDVSGGENPNLIDLAEQHGSGYVLMHAKGSPKTMQDSPTYEDVVAEVKAFMDEKTILLAARRLPRFWMDPGIGFGKTLEHNLSLMGNLSAFHDERRGLLLGASRKSWIDRLCGATDPNRRLGGSIAAAVEATRQGVEIIRAHDVEETVQALQAADAIVGSS